VKNFSESLYAVSLKEEKTAGFIRRLRRLRKINQETRSPLVPEKEFETRSALLVAPSFCLGNPISSAPAFVIHISGIWKLGNKNMGVRELLASWLPDKKLNLW